MKKAFFISPIKCYLSIYGVPDIVLSTRHKSRGKYNPVLKDSLGGEVRGEYFLGSVMVSSSKAKALGHFLLSQKIHKANQLRELERATIYVKNAAAAAKLLQSCPTVCDPRDGSPPFPGVLQARTLGVGCHFLLQWMKVKSENEVAQSCPTLSDPMDCSLPGSSIHVIFQAGVLEWGAIAFSVC